MNMLDLEEYLISIGAKVDRTSFRSAQQQAAELGRTFIKAAAVIEGALLGITAATARSVKATAEADTGYAKLARQMWITKDAAKELSLVLDAMGESQEDVAWIPELREQYGRLRDELRSIGQPAEFGSALKTIKELNFQWQSFQLKISKLKETVSIYMVKYLTEPLDKAGLSLTKLNGIFKKDFYPTADWIARRLTDVINIVLSLYRAAKALFDAADRFIGELPGHLKATLAAITVLLAGFMAGPIGIMLMTIGMLLILVEDFFGYLDGRKSSKTMAPVWKWLVELGKSNKLNWVKSTTKDILNLFYELFNLIKNIATSDFVKALLNALAAAARHLTAIGRIAVKLLTAFIQILNGDLKGAAKTMASMADVVREMYPGQKPGGKGTILGAGDNGVLYSQGPLKQTPIEAGIEDEGLARTDENVRRAVDIVNARIEGKTGKSMTVTSGWRSEENNRAAGGVEDSYHLHGRAVDLNVDSFSADERRDIESYFEDMGFETLYHDAGSGLHLHIEAPYGSAQQLPEVHEIALPEQGPQLPDTDPIGLPGLAPEHSLDEIANEAASNANYAIETASAGTHKAAAVTLQSNPQIKNEINITVQGSNASPQDIAKETARAVEETNRTSIAALIRNEQTLLV